MSEGDTGTSLVAVLLRIEGRVQGVGYRAWTVREARALGLAGWVRNRSDGSVEAMVVGAAEPVAALERACRRGPRLASVTAIARTPCTVPAEILAAGGFSQIPTL
ncbi:MAG: acylphosphatase [Alphaproteobacteria bacterium]|nr:acylphosphatase [Alphaproteobacteria bacterium]